MNILDKIVVQKKIEIEIAKQRYPIKDLQRSELYKRSCISLSDSLKDGLSLGIIAEYKRESPSKGLINIHQNTAKDVAIEYQNSGASAMSVLTDRVFFGAEEEDILLARANCKLPILRKEFIIDAYQVYESKAMGADIILLIGAILSKRKSKELSTIAHDLGMEILYEIHDEKEIELIPDDVEMVGINNRDLKYFKVDFERSMRMFDQLPKDQLKIAESGISDFNTVIDLKRKGFNGFLIGETFMKTKTPGITCGKFIQKALGEI
jgi:indole-3-glycerol phosphate synthase